MKRILLTTVLGIFILTTRAQTTGTFNVYGGSDQDETKGAVLLPDGSRVILSASESTDGDVSGAMGWNDAWLAKINSAGQILWEKNYGGSNEDIPQMIQRTSDNGFVIAGYTMSLDGDITHDHLVYDTLDFGGIPTPIVITNNEFWILKLDSNGNVLWSKTYGGFNNDEAYSVVQTQDGGYFVVGTTVSLNDGDVSGVHGPTDTTYDTKPQDVWALKLDAGGNMQWSRAYGGDWNETGVRAIQTQDLGYIIAANSSSRSGDVTGHANHIDTIGWDYWVFKVDQSGALQWNKNFGGTDDDVVVDMAILNDGTIAVAGHTYSDDGDLPNDNDPTHFWVIGLNKNGSGSHNWMRPYGGEGLDLMGSITATADGGFILGGSTNSPYPGLSRAWPAYAGMDGWLVKVAATGEAEWDKTIGGNSFDRVDEVLQKADGSYVSFGSTQSNDIHAIGNHGNEDVLVVEISAVRASQLTAYICDGSLYRFPSRFHPDSLLLEPGKYLHSINMGGYDSTVVLTLYLQTMDFDGIAKNGSDLQANEANADAYQWIDCATKQPILNEIARSFSPTQNGDYAVLVTKNGCSDTSLCMPVTLSGLPNISNGAVSVYPNPAIKSLTLFNTTEGQGTLTDLLGRTLISFETVQGKTELDLSHLDNGYYFIHLSDSDGNHSSVKVLINR